MDSRGGADGGDDGGEDCAHESASGNSGMPPCPSHERSAVPR